MSVASLTSSRQVPYATIKLTQPVEWDERTLCMSVACACVCLCMCVCVCVFSSMQCIMHQVQGSLFSISSLHCFHTFYKSIRITNDFKRSIFLVESTIIISKSCTKRNQ